MKLRLGLALILAAICFTYPLWEEEGGLGWEISYIAGAICLILAWMYYRTVRKAAKE